MKIYHLDCATLCPKIFNIIGGPEKLVCHCILIEINDRLILIDSGIGKKILESNYYNNQKLIIKNILGYDMNIDQSAYTQIKNLGFNPKDVQDIFLTHLDIDHASGLLDFPWAKVHLLEDEFNAGIKKIHWSDKIRYSKNLYNNHKEWIRYNSDGESWNGFKKVKPLINEALDLFLIPLPGHSKGHAGYSFNGHFYVGDSYMMRKQMTHLESPNWVHLYNKLIQNDLEIFTNNLNQLHQLDKNNKDVHIFCSHDASEYSCFC